MGVKFSVKPFRPGCKLPEPVNMAIKRCPFQREKKKKAQEFNHSHILSINKYLLNTHYMSSTVPGPQNRQSPFHHRAEVLLQKT